MWITCFEFRQKATEISDERIIIAFEAGKPHTQSVSELNASIFPTQPCRKTTLVKILEVIRLKVKT